MPIPTGATYSDTCVLGKTTAERASATDDLCSETARASNLRAFALDEALPNPAEEREGEKEARGTSAHHFGHVTRASRASRESSITSCLTFSFRPA